MYNIIQLNDKNLSELQAIAQELGIKKTDSLKKEELVYKILDEQAIAGATKKVAADKLKEDITIHTTGNSTSIMVIQITIRLPQSARISEPFIFSLPSI